MGHQLHPDPARTTEFAPAQGYGPAAEALPWKAGRFSGRDFVRQPVLWRDWSRWQHRRACMQLLAGQRLEVQMAPPLSANSGCSSSPLSRAQRAHYRLSWQEQLARNARAPGAGQVTIKLFGVPEGFATFLGLLTT